jgi:hypothetical protein
MLLLKLPILWVSYRTTIMAVSPDLTGSPGHSGTVQPQVDLTFLSTSCPFPALTKENLQMPSEEKSISPKLYTVSVKAISAFLRADRPGPSPVHPLHVIAAQMISKQVILIVFFLFKCMAKIIIFTVYFPWQPLQYNKQHNKYLS